MYSAIVVAFFESLKSFFSAKESNLEHISEIEMIEDKCDLEKACRCAEIAISCAEKYRHNFSKLDRASFIRNVKKFRKYK